MHGMWSFKRAPLLVIGFTGKQSGKGGKGDEGKGKCYIYQGSGKFKVKTLYPPFGKSGKGGKGQGQGWGQGQGFASHGADDQQLLCCDTLSEIVMECRPWHQGLL